MFETSKYVKERIHRVVSSSKIPTDRKQEVEEFLINKCGYRPKYPNATLPVAVARKHFGDFYHVPTYLQLFRLDDISDAFVQRYSLTEQDLIPIVYDVFAALSRKGQAFYREPQ